MSEDVQTQAGVDLLAAIKNYLKLHYSPAGTGANTFFLSTDELRRRLHDLYPTDTLNNQVVAEWMQELGYRFEDNGQMQLEWKMERFGVS